MNDPLIGQHLGNYRIDNVIGRGGMATVYHGWDESLHRPVALKVIDARYRDNPAYAERFLQEARAVATWRHSNILQVFYAGQSDDLYYFAMEYVDGPDLSRLMKQYADAGELLPHSDVLKIGRAVASALDYAHSQGIIHRDVKPSNVVVAKDGRIALADFGLALNAQQGSFGSTFGTPHYIAPEQARSSAMAVPQSDLYALGVILYEMLTGSVPFDDPSPTTLALQHVTQPPPPPRQINANLNGATEEVLLKALSKQPDDRYQTGAALMAALATALNAPKTDDESVSLPPLPGVVLPVLSQTTVAERVSLYMPPPPPSVRGSELATPSPSISATDSKSFSVGRLIVVSVVVLLLLGAGWLFLDGKDWIATAVIPIASSPTARPTEEPTETATRPQATEVALLDVTQDTAVPPTVTPEPTTATSTSTPTPTSTATSTLTLTPTPTYTPTPEPSATEQATVAPSSQPATAPTAETPTTTPTTIPSGPRLVMDYNATSFYLYNPTDDFIRVSNLAFQPLDENGAPSGILFEGLNWSSIYSFVDPLHCNGLEIADESDWLRPSQCSQYNVTLTPELGHRFIFWTQQPDVVAFSVTWRDEEVGRCDVTAGQCEVYLP